MALWYSFRENSPGVYGVAGFDPLEVGPVKNYTIRNGNCDCPARTPTCKHLNMLGTLRETGSFTGKFIDDESLEIIEPIGDEPIPLP